MTELKKFSIDYIVSRDLGNEVNRWKASRGYDITCPFCGGVRKFNVNVEKNVARCNRCGTAYNPVTLHAALTGKSNSDAYKDLVQLSNSSKGNEVMLQVQQRSEKIRNLASEYVWMAADYNDKFLSLLKLSDEHKQDLMNRGLTERQIEIGRYKTLPISNQDEICLKSLVLPNKERYAYLFKSLKFRLPGFYDLNTDEPKLVKRSNCYLIPVKTLEQFISCFQIRYDPLSPDASDEDKASYHKYAWLSSNEKESGVGVSGVQTINHAGFAPIFNDDGFNIPTYKTVGLTEGILKSDIAAYLSGNPFIGLPGVNNLSQLESCLTRLMDVCNTECINICIDMDYREKKEVASALENIEAIISKVGLRYRIVNWDSKYKGIDDFLNAKRLASAQGTSK